MHFPIIGNSYGALALLRSQLLNDEKFAFIPEDLVGEALEQNLNLVPAETFVYDEIKPLHLEKWLDAITFYNEMDIGLTTENFVNMKALKHFVPLATFDMGDDVGRHHEYVSTFEGTVLPIFGYGYRLDKV